MEIRILKNDQETLNQQNTVAAQLSPLYGFLQSSHWGNFKRSIGNRVITVGAFSSNKLLGFGQFVPSRKWYWPKGYSFEVFRGPALPENFYTEEVKSGTLKASLFLSETSYILKKHRACFSDFLPTKTRREILLEPSFLEDTSSQVHQFYKEQGYKYSSKALSPKQTLFLNIQQDIDTLKSQMHQKTRYNINLSMKKNLKFTESRGKQAVESFLRLMNETSKRNGFRNFSDSYYRKLLKNTPDQFSKLFLVEDIDEQKVLAAGIWIFFGKTCTYLFGASSNENRNKMPTFFMHYKALEFAKTNGYWFYDFYGIDSLGTKKGWEGITRFKRSFGGQEVTFLNAYVKQLK